MAIQGYPTPPLDFNLFTGPTRMLSGPSRYIVPSVNVPYGEVMRWMYVGVTGNVVFLAPDAVTQVTLIGLASSVWHPINSLAILSGTTATGIVLGS